MDEKNDILEFIELAKKLKEKNKDAFMETKGYLRGLVESQEINTKIAQ